MGGSSIIGSKALDAEGLFLGAAFRNVVNPGAGTGGGAEGAGVTVLERPRLKLGGGALYPVPAFKPDGGPITDPRGREVRGGR